MADTQNQNVKKFLDYGGLSKFWELIQSKVAGSLELTTGKTTGATFVLKSVDGTILSGGENDKLNIPVVSADNEVGLMTSDMYTKLEAVSGNIDAAVKLEGVAFNGNAATIASIGTGDNIKDKHVNLDFKYEDTKIKLVDLNNVVDGKPAVLTSIDASEFVADGILESVTWGEGDKANTLVFTFNTASGKDAIPVDLSKFIDTYTAGNGIDVTNKVISAKIAEGEKYLTVDADGIKTTGIETAITNALASYYTKDEVDGTVAGINATVELKANAADVYTKTEVDTELAKKANSADSLSGYGITDAYTKDEVDAKFAEWTPLTEDDIKTIVGVGA